MSTNENTKSLLQLDDAMIREIVRDPRFSFLPCVGNFNSAIADSKNCARCKKKRDAKFGEAIKNFTSCLTKLPPGARKQFKSLLNAQKVRVTRMTAKGQVQVTF